MMNSAIKFSSVSFVGVGDFSPPQFSPDWLQSEGLIRKEDVDVKKTLIAYEFSEFVIPGIVFRVDKNSLRIEAYDERYFEFVKDLVIGIFSILDRTPVRCFGINYEYHFQTETEKGLDKLRDMFVAPRKIWEQNLKSPIELRDATILIKNKFSSKKEDYIGITLSGSNELSSGVRVFVNNYFEIKQKTALDRTSYLVELIKNNWSEIQKESKYILDKIMEQST